MKARIYSILLLTAAFLVMAGCDQDFEEINTNPYAISRLDPPLLFANAVRQTHPGHWEGEATIVQQFVNAYNLGATAGPNFNEDTDNFNIPKWNTNYPNTIKLLVKAIELAREEPGRTNLIGMMRIWKAFVFMTMVDTYADVPYVDAGQGDYDLFFPRYDDDKVVYDSLYNELKSATAALSTTGEFVPADLFYRSTGNAAAQVAQWKKLGNSLLLRLGMRYSKIDPDKAEDIVVEAVNGGVMTANTDDVFLLHNSSYVNPMNNGPRTINTYYYYVAEPFVDYLKATNDPRAKFMIAKYANPAQATTTAPDVTLANQFGFPVGYDSETIKEEVFNRGTLGGGLNYSQLNFNVVGHSEAPLFFVTNSQTKFLLAEATERGWISSQGTVQELYEAGIRASMDQWSKYPNGSAISITDQDNYIAHPDVAFDEANALELIGTQYWVSNFNNGPEAWANFRRIGFPALTPNSYNDNLGGGFVRRLSYPNTEAGQNEVNYVNAAAAIGGDNLTTRVFWDEE